MRTIIRHLILLSLCMALPAFAEDEAEAEAPQFDVEIIVVRNVSPDDTEKRIPIHEAVPTEEAEEAVDQAPTIRIRRYPALDPGERRLDEIEERLQRSENWSPVLHVAWRQPAESREEAAATSVAGSRLGASVTGTVRLSLERFLRVEIDLELDPQTGELYQMQQARRLRSGEFHYFDHPQFGVIALVSRPPQDAATP